MYETTAEQQPGIQMTEMYDNNAYDTVEVEEKMCHNNQYETIDVEKEMHGYTAYETIDVENIMHDYNAYKHIDVAKKVDDNNAHESSDVKKDVKIKLKLKSPVSLSHDLLHFYISSTREAMQGLL